MKMMKIQYFLGAWVLFMGLEARAVEDRLSLLALPHPETAIDVSVNSDQITTAWVEKSIDVTILPGKGGPAVTIRPAEGMWDLSRFGHVEAMITNPMDVPLKVNMRVDNPGDWRDKPWNSESVKVLPGKTMPLKVIFGHQYGYKPGYKLDSSQVEKILFYINKTNDPVRFQIETVRASGEAGEKPAVDPRYVRHVPKAGYILGGAGVQFDASAQVSAGKGVVADTVVDQGETVLEMDLPANAADQPVVITPVSGRWDLSQSNEMKVRISNVGEVPVLPAVYIANGGGAETTDTVRTETPLAAGESREIVVSYLPEMTWVGPEGDLSHPSKRKGTGGTKFRSEKAEKIVLRFGYEGEAKVRIDSVQAIASTRPLPEWVGKRPPVEGEWVMTLEDEFEGDSINEDLWHVHGPNWWGNHKLTHWSRDNTIVEGGTATIRMEKKPGFHNDDPESTHSDYQGGVLRSYGKWTQTYGYFESRMKLPTAAAMWPAFWLMPDRGESFGEQWKRSDISKDAMEFDIMEHLTRWGPYRYTTAMHWDGYGKEHKATGTTVYFYPDEEGYVTSGVLWLPGLMVYYCNGREVARWEHERISTIPSFILYTMPLGGWDNEKVPNDEELPADFVIDYVRVWQLKAHL